LPLISIICYKTVHSLFSALQISQRTQNTTH